MTKQDDSALRAAREAMAGPGGVRLTDELFDLVVEHLHVGVLVQGPSAEILFSNPMALELLGLSLDQLLGKTSFDPSWRVVHEDGSDFPGPTHPVPVAVATRAPVRSVVMGVDRPAKRDRVWLLVNAEPHLDERGEVKLVVCTFTDISERKRLEEAYSKAQKLELVGRLAGGVAHDFNNILFIIQSLGEMMLANPALSPQVRRDVGNIVDASTRGAGLTRQLLAFARKGRSEPRLVALHEELSSMRRMIEQVLGASITLRLEAFDQGWLVKADPTHIEQIVLNLVVNARDAMSHGGAVSITTSHARRDGADVVVLVVSDTGVGMTDEVKRQAFEAFFTTKGEGRGTGLGLATVHDLVGKLGARIELVSAPGEGASFTIEVPAVKGETGPQEVRAKVDAAFKGVVLLVEDDATMRGVIARLLGRRGMRVLEAADGLEALSLIGDQPRDDIELVVTDVMMPRLGGRELVEQALPMLPRAKVLFISGLADIGADELSKGSDRVRFLQKPFTGSVMMAVVGELLAGREG